MVTAFAQKVPAETGESSPASGRPTGDTAPRQARDDRNKARCRGRSAYAGGHFHLVQREFHVIDNPLNLRQRLAAGGEGEFVIIAIAELRDVQRLPFREQRERVDALELVAIPVQRVFRAGHVGDRQVVNRPEARGRLQQRLQQYRS